MWPGCVDCVYNAPKLDGNVALDVNGNPINSIDLGRRELQSTALVKGGSSTVSTPEPVNFYVGDILVGRGSVCLEPAHGFFFDKNGQVTSCKKLMNCMQGYCTPEGCTKCEDGYYIDKDTGECKTCKVKNLQGCAKCTSDTECIECTSDFLQVVPVESYNRYTRKTETIYTCKCNIYDGIFPHLSQDRRGSCVCDDGYWLTELGCRTCSDLIPGCE